MRLIILTVVCLLLSLPDRAAGQPVEGAGGRKRAAISRVAADAIRVDGRLDEDAWLRAEPIADFVQKEPDEGKKPTDDMEVRFAYDDDTLYVAARMFTRNASAVQAALSRRDNTDQSEKFVVALDTFFDHLTAVEFGVTAPI